MATNLDYRMKFDRTQTILIFFLLIIAAGLRVPKIGIPLYNEEYLDLFWFGQVPWKDLILEYTNPGQKSLVAIIWKISKFLFGEESEIIFRAGSWIPGILAIPLLYKVGVTLFRSHYTGFISATFLACSHLHLKQSLYLRGYSLTAFLSLVVTYCVIMITHQEKSRLWRVLLIVAGISMVLTLPSNANFLLAVTLFYLMSVWDRHENIRTYFNINFLKSLLPFIVLGITTILYFIQISDDLRYGMSFYGQYYLSLGLNPNWNWPAFFEVLKELSKPWGPGLYVLFFYGLVILKNKKKLLPFLMIF